MDQISYAHSAKQSKRIKMFIAEPDSTSGLVSLPKVIEAGESITIPDGRVVVHPNLEIDGTLTIENDGELFVPFGGTLVSSDLMHPVDTIDNLRNETGKYKYVYVTGHHAKDDGAFGSNMFVWDEDSTETDNGGTIIKCSTVTNGRYKLKYSGAVNVKWFGAVGDGVTDDTTEFALLEANVTGHEIDLHGKVYKVSLWFTKNKYFNGTFKIGDVQYPASLDAFGLIYKKLCMDFYTGDATVPGLTEIFAGAKNTFQGFAIIPVGDNFHLFVTQSSYGDGTYPNYGNFLKGETYRIVEYLFTEDGSLQNPISFSEPLNLLGHASHLGYRYENGQLYLYSGAPNDSTTDTALGGKGFTRIKWHGSSTSNTDVQIYTMFDQPSVVSGNYPNLCRCAVSTTVNNEIVLRGDDDGKDRVVIYDLDEVLSASNPKSVKAKATFVIPAYDGTFQGLAVHDDLVWVLSEGGYHTLTIRAYDLTGTIVKEIKNIDTSKAFRSYAEYLGGSGDVITLYEGEGLYIHANCIYFGQREYWHEIVDVVTYNSKYYTPISSNVSGYIPTDEIFWLEIPARSGATAWDATSTYSYGTRTRLAKRVIKLTSIADSRTLPIYASNQPYSIKDTLNSSTLNLRWGSTFSLNYVQPKGDDKSFISFNGGNVIRFYDPSGDGNGNCLRMTLSRKEGGNNYVALRGDESHGGSLFLYSKDDSSEYAGGLREFVGTTSFTNNRKVKATGETTVYSYSGVTFTADTNGNGDGLAQSRSGQLKYSVYANSGYTWITSRNSNALRFATSTSDNLETPNGFEFSLNGALIPLSTDKAIGSPTKTWSNIYLQNTPIVSSDERLKQNFRSLRAAEKAAAIEIKESICMYKMRDSVEEKGDGARWHVGVKAQQVVSILESHGLDPFEYGFVCFDEWDEQEEVKDEEGNITQEYRPAGNKYAIRYEELLCFIMSAI